MRLYSRTAAEEREYCCYADIDNDGQADTRFEPDGAVAVLLDSSWHKVAREGNAFRAMVNGGMREIALNDLRWNAD